ncbi:hypothetical protein [uncultured Nostoc sp.]|uniref:hypothetical protein n=1 Tax=uncultured Nostoc sp. TaxID=340711 RepID=UPI0035C9737B
MTIIIISGQSIEQTHLGSNGKFYLNKLPDPNSDKLIIASNLGRTTDDKAIRLYDLMGKKQAEFRFSK